MTGTVERTEGLRADRYVNERGASEFTGYATGTLRNMRCEGRGPKYLRVGRSIRYRLSDLTSWVECSEGEA